MLVPGDERDWVTLTYAGLLGDFMADAMLAYRLNESASADFALINAGGIRATIDEGPITRGEVLTSFPFGNSLVEISMSTGRDAKPQASAASLAQEGPCHLVSNDHNPRRVQ